MSAQSRAKNIYSLHVFHSEYLRTKGKYSLEGYTFVVKQSDLRSVISFVLLLRKMS